MAKSSKLSAKDTVEIAKLLDKRRYHVGNIVNLERKCGCGSWRGYTDNKKVICMGCQTVQGKDVENGTAA